MLVVDQLNVEKKGIPTVTITTTAYEKLVKAALKEQGVAEIALVTVTHNFGRRPLVQILSPGSQLVIAAGFPCGRLLRLPLVLHDEIPVPVLAGDKIEHVEMQSLAVQS